MGRFGTIGCMKRYNPKEIEPKWQQKWEKSGIYRATEDSSKPKRYVLEYFPYPSGAAMHVGHVRNYTIGDAVARFYRMQGENVLHPMGWDAFGLPAENFAIKNNISPKEAIRQNTSKFKQQLIQMGFSYDWSREINSTDPSYYKWTQWFFKLLFERGLAYQKESLQWWCDTDKTVLANEQVEAGKCWRCGNPVTKKPLKQWFFKITDYADRLTEDLDKLDWSDAIKAMQKNWIGKSKGAEIDFAVANSDAGSKTQEARSYVMGQKNISKEDIEAIGGTVERVTDAGYLCVKFPLKAVQPFEELITEKMEPGFWNEYIGDEVVFIFKDKQGVVTRLVWSDETESELLELCNEYAGAQFESIETMIQGNEWYKGLLPTSNFQLPTSIKVFTTRPDTLFGATFMVLAPEHELVQKITTKSQKSEVDEYIKQAQAKSDVERQETNREKTGVFTGAYAINPVNEEKIPIWIADYVLTGYGTGAIMAVPAHDERDFEFAQKFNLPVRGVIAPDFGMPLTNPVDVTGPVVVGYDPRIKKFMSLINTKNNMRWFASGGLVDGENYEDAALRELAEEAGYKNVKKLIKLGGPTYSYYYNSNKDSNRRSFSYMYLAIIDSKEQREQALEAHEQYEVTWSDAQTILDDFQKEPDGRGHWIDGMQRAQDAAAAYNRGLEYSGPVISGEGILFNSEAYDGLQTSEAREKIVADLAAKNVGEEKVNYKIRDWLISRQRYWGAPIPIIHCEKDGAVAVPDDQLPVELPEVESYQPKGEGTSVLASVESWVNTTCPKCGGPAKRETDTMDGFACSSWYFLRFADPYNNNEPFNKEKADFWLPVDDYIGGAEHAVMHLLYARMWTKVMFDAKMINFDEPFKALRNQGMILAPDGRKMSKSWGNVIAPDEIIDQGYGADAIRLMELFIGPWNQEAAWSVEGMGGCFRFLQRVWTLIQEFIDAEKSDQDQAGQEQKELIISTHKTIKKVTEDMHSMGFNTAIATLMAMTNDLYKIKSDAGFKDTKNWQFALESLLKLLAPFAPHITEELWADLAQKESIHTTEWPSWEDKYLISDTMKIVVQVNGKVRATIEVPSNSEKEEVLEVATKNERVAEYLNGNSIKKTIYVPNKLVNFVV